MLLSVRSKFVWGSVGSSGSSKQTLNGFHGGFPHFGNILLALFCDLFHIYRLKFFIYETKFLILPKKLTIKK